MSFVLKVLNLINHPFGCCCHRTKNRSKSVDPLIDKSQKAFTEAVTEVVSEPNSFPNVSHRDVCLIPISEVPSTGDIYAQVEKEDDYGNSCSDVTPPPFACKVYEMEERGELSLQTSVKMRNIDIKDIVSEEISLRRNDSAFVRLKGKFVSEGYNGKLLQEKLDEEFMIGSIFQGMCCSLCIQMVLDNKMEPDPEFQGLQRMLELFLLSGAVKYNIPLTLDQKIFDFTDGLVNSVIENFSQYVFKKYGLTISFVNGAEEKIYNSAIEMDELSDELFKEEDNLILLSSQTNDFTLSHVIYFNAGRGIIGDGKDGLIVQIPPGVDRMAFLKEFVNQRMEGKKIKCTILSIKKEKV